MLFQRAAAFVGLLVAFHVAQTMMGTGGSIAISAHCVGFGAGFVLMGDHVRPPVVGGGPRLAAGRREPS